MSVSVGDGGAEAECDDGGAGDDGATALYTSELQLYILQSYSSIDTSALTPPER